MKKKLLVFHKALAPYRIDFFNELNTAFDADIYFFRKSLQSQKFDMNMLVKQLNFVPKFLTLGFELLHKGRIIRFGYLKKIVKFKPDVIICLEFSIITFEIALFSKLFFSRTKVYTICDDSVVVARNSSLLRKLGRFLSLKLLDGIILCNDSAKEWYDLNFPNVKKIVFPIIQNEERIQSILKVAEPISNQYLSKYQLKYKNVLLFVGRLVKVKNLNLLIDVFSQYIAFNKNAVLILVGDGDKKGELLKQTKRLKIQDKVIFAGRFENEELYAWYQIADYFILPSIYESFGAVVNESLIAGVPVICSDLAGASYLICENNGVTFNPYDKNKLLLILKNKLRNKRDNSNNQLSNSSLMPYTFDEKMQALISFLKYN